MESWGRGNTRWVDYYASFETVVSDSEAPGDLATVVIDAIPKSAATALKTLEHERVVEDLDHHFPVFLLTATLESERAKALVDSPGWIELSIGTDQFGEEDSFEASAIYFDGDEEGARTSFWVKVRSTSVAKRNLSALERLAALPTVADATASSLLPFNCADGVRGVAVYDVGQANLCALVDAAEHPVVFFDLGWPLSFNGKSRRLPGPFDPLIPTLQNIGPQPVILSHLDWDHWGFAFHSGRALFDSQRGHWRSVVRYKDEALRRPWLMRRPRFHRHKLGPSHIHFVLTLSRTTLSDGRPALTFWPAKRARLDFTHYTVVRCSPSQRREYSAAYLRNNESLVLSAKLEHRPEKVLLTGDADYPSIPANHLRGLTGIVAPHHGGAVTEFSTPVAPRGSRMIRSTYPGCYRSVPSDDAETEAELSGWEIHSTNVRVKCPSTCCVHGNKLIPLDVLNPKCICRQVSRAGLCLS